mmetsp:Transcript_13199/g.20501  ORF Transcript_13199/g.20501 Transcript_13199/m.20501 type:complete len:297 (-) Transcript_13199:225-1115(-)
MTDDCRAAKHITEQIYSRTHGKFLLGQKTTQKNNPGETNVRPEERSHNNMSIDSVCSTDDSNGRKPCIHGIRDKKHHFHRSMHTGHHEKGDSSKTESLANENRRLRDLINDYERILRISSGESTTSSNTGQTVTDSHSDSQHYEECKEEEEMAEETVAKLKEKIRAMKSKRKREKINTLRMEKKLDAYGDEIRGLQYELDRTLAIVEKMKKERADNNKQIQKLKKQLLEAKDQHRTSPYDDTIENIRSDLQKRDSEVEATLELLQSKVERIIELEYQVEKYRNKCFERPTKILDTP